MKTILNNLARWLYAKTMPAALAGNQWSGTNSFDAYHRRRQPTPNELMAELKNTAWTCASINASVCANFPPSLYAITEHNQPRPECLTKTLHPAVELKLRSNPRLKLRLKSAEKIEEVTKHPLLAVLNQPNPFHSSYDLWELTTLYQEVQGHAYWYLDLDGVGKPVEIWLLPSQNVTPMRGQNSSNIVDFYRYRSGHTQHDFDPSTIIHFRYPDPRDPYTGGISPLKAAYEQVAMTSTYATFKTNKFDNHAIPDAIISPDEVIGEEERDRLEAQWNSKMRRHGAGRVIVAESGMKAQILAHSMGDLAALADIQATKEDIANAFHVPISYLTSQTNLANLQASRSQHSEQAIGPRLARRDEKLNQQFVPLFEPNGRLFVASQDPVPVDQSMSIQQQENDLKYGVISINEVRSERGLSPVPWGNVPWLNMRLAPTDVPRGPAQSSDQGQETDDPDVDT